MENAGNTNLDTRCDNYKERKKERDGRIRVSFNKHRAMKEQKVSQP